jgi:hypothetical protein
MKSANVASVPGNLERVALAHHPPHALSYPGSTFAALLSYGKFLGDRQ